MEWLIEVVSFYELKSATLIRSISTLDLYLRENPDKISLHNLQLLAAASLLHTTAKSDFPFKISQNNVNHSAADEIGSLFDANIFEVIIFI